MDMVDMKVLEDVFDSFRFKQWGKVWLSAAVRAYLKTRCVPQYLWEILGIGIAASAFRGDTNATQGYSLCGLKVAVAYLQMEKGLGAALLTFEEVDELKAAAE